MSPIIEIIKALNFANWILILLVGSGIAFWVLAAIGFWTVVT